ncbi:MAG: pyridoxamine 5'-phosphate oxidase family protein [Eubacteriales bacterium]|nr:pyridoxamine 5'-phosphate oxidase family protein [Eubacteriales bacterium]
MEEFRKMRRFKQQVTDEECSRILTEEKRGALAVIGDGGYPYAIPIDFYYDEEHKRIYFHGARSGHKADAMKNCDKVCFTTWNQGFKKEGHWEWNATSVVVFGRARFVEDPEEISGYLRKLAEKYYPTQEEVEEEMNSSAMQRVLVTAIEIEHMTGKLVNEK